MIEGGVAGSSALEQASHGRAAAERLLAETRRWEQLAADRRETAAQVAMLPPAYAVLHDLMVSASATGVDHVVVGPGGAFSVVSHRYPEAIAYRDGQLWAGHVSLHDDIQAARRVAQQLGQLLGSPVVPLVAFLQAVMPAAAPRAIDGVLVAGGDTIVRVITRASHTLLTPPEVADVVERALPLLHSPGSVVRSASAKEVARDPQPAPTTVAAPAAIGHRASAGQDAVSVAASGAEPAGAERWARRKAERAERRVARAQLRRPEPDTRELAAVPSATTVVPATADASTGTGGAAPRTRRIKLVVGALAVLCLVAVAVGTAARLWSPDGDEGGRAATAATPAVPATTLPVPTVPAPTLPVPTVPAPTVPLGSAIVVPQPRSLPSCPAPGSGWTVSIGFPGSQTGVLQYELEQQLLDASWAPLGALSADSPSLDLATGQQAGAFWVLRLVALGENGRTVGEPAVLGPPSVPC